MKMYLYDMENDIAEKHNLVEKLPEIKYELMTKFEKLTDRSGC